MNQKLLSKILATMLAVILTFANFVMLGVYATNSYATTDALESQTTVSNNKNVEFDAYFVDEKGNKTHTAKQDIDANLILYLAVNVEKGYLKNTKIKMLGQDGEQSNFKIINSDEVLDTVESIDEDNNIVSLKQINSGTNVVLEVPIASINSDIFDLSNFSKINNITLTGSYIDNQGKQVEIEKTISIRNEWQKEVKATIEQAIKTFIPYEVENTTGTILQTIVKTGLENNSLPIKESKVTVKVPELNGKMPEEVLVTSNGTYATNNQSGEEFLNTNWTYDETTGTITITVENKANENKVVWNKENKDEYVITYIYKEKVDNIEVQEKVNVEIESYNNVITKVSEENTLNIKEENRLGNLVTTQITSSDVLSKGYLYTKSEKELEYNKNIKLEIGYANLVDKIIIKDSIDNFINSKNEVNPTTVSNTNYSYYKKTYVSKENFERILGTDGYIKIIGQDGEQLAIFTKDSNADENGNYTYEYASETNQIKIETSKPIIEGTLEINNIKSLKGKTDYSKSQIEDFQKLQLEVDTNVEYASKTIETVNANKDITLIAPTTKFEVSVSNENLSTVVKNENVEFRVILKTNDITCDLYKNPVVEIVLPNYIKEINVKNVDLLFSNELTIKDKKTYVNENGNIVIQITLEGEETTYIQNEVSKGANIVVNTDITLKKLTPTKEDTVRVYVTNENVTTYENTEISRVRTATQKGYTTTTLNAVAPVGVVTTNTIEGYNQNGETVTSISGEEQVGKLETRTESKNATVKINVINNYSNVIKNISILGRIPFENNKNTSTKEDLGSNLTTILNSTITSNGLDTSKVTVYYTTNPEATKDLQDINNGWTKTIEDIKTIKSYLIVLNDYEMTTGETIEFSYGITIPENLSHNLWAYSNYTVYFDNVKTREIATEQVTATKVGLTTGEGPELEVNVSNNDTEVEEGKYATYTIVVKNTGKTVANNINVNVTATQNNKNIGTKAENIETMKAGETYTITYTVKARGKRDEEENIKLNATITADNLEKEIVLENEETKVATGYLTTSFDTGAIEVDEIRQENSEVQYVLKIYNVNKTPKEEVIVTDKLPEGLTFKEANLDGIYDETTRTVTWNLGTIDGNGSKTLVLTTTTDEITGNETEKTITNQMTITTKDKEIKSEAISIKVAKPSLTITASTETEEKVAVGGVIAYKFIIKNEGAGVATSVKFEDVIPEGLKYQEVQYSINGKTTTSKIGNDKAVVTISALGSQEQAEVIVKMVAKELDAGTTQREVVNKATITATNIGEKTSNEIKHIIVPVSSTDNNDPSTEVIEPNTYKISGIVWQDSNKDGKRDDNEERISNITVTLINAENGQIVTDTTTGIKKEQQTNENGVYTFSNIKPGKYMVIFQYDTSYYTLTTYQKEGVNDTQNSDVVSANAQIQGETIKVATSDKLTLEEQDIENIDMGLYTNDKFDLSLDKVITKITMQNNNEVKTYEYNDSKFAKLDLNQKTINSTTIIVEYKIRVKNEGDIAGYAKKIVDFIPQDMEFSSELNKDWYQSTNGNAYNASLANTLINPGETKELTLILTKKMTEDNLGIINNNAEIYESYNDLGIADVDSIPANNVQTEDDISSADVMIGVKTGETYVYITITLISIALLGVGIYFINKKVLRKI